MDVVTIGRSSANDYVIPDSHASRHHCQLIRHDNGSFELVDISSYGTYVNGRKVNKRIYLHKGDIVKVGNTCIPWMSYFGQSTMVPTYETEDTLVVSYPYQNPPATPIVTPPVVNIPSEININKHEECSNVAKRGDDFSVSFNRNLGDKMGDTIGTTLGCIVSIIIVIIVIAIIGFIAF